jgi:hypothetical protein
VNTAAAAAREQPVSRWRWAAWWAALVGGVLVFYVLLTPVWIGLRLAAWAAELRARERRPS